MDAEKKIYRVEIEVVSTTWESAEAFVVAESEEEARKLFEDDPYAYDWDNWETHDSDVRSWEVDSVEYDEWLTEHERQLTEQENAQVQSND
jgi:hypothetical protein